MPSSWVRLADSGLLSSRPLLDLGVGDGLTVRALAPGPGLVVGVDASGASLRAAARADLRALVRADAAALPFPAAAFACALAADLLHHLDDRSLGTVLAEARRVLQPGAVLVAWWYGVAGRPDAGGPSYPRPLAEVMPAALAAGFASVDELAFAGTLELEPRTVGMTARVPGPRAD